MRERIDGLQRGLDEKESTRREARDALRDSERAISDANRALTRLGAEERAVRAEARRFTDRRRQLEQTLAEQQAGLDRLLAARHQAGAPDALRAALSGEHPGELARRLVYLSRVSQATSMLAASVRQGIAELDELRRDALHRAARLAAIEAAQRADRARLVAQREERRRVLQRTAAELRAQTRQIRVMRADEARLARLVEALGRVLASPSGQQGVDKVTSASGRVGPFSSLRGKLRWPVRGELRGASGTPTAAGGGVAKGVFIRAAPGQPVRAVADGQVVFADWMRGFGNVLIVDHGETYLSIYANNESLLKQVGEPVAGGEALATVGASGGSAETGLYFELRRFGKPLDSRRWISLK